MNIIPYEARYQDQVTELITTIQQQEFKIPITLNDQPDLKTIPQSYQATGGNFWVAIDQEKVVGTIALIRIKHDNGVLRKMFVKPAYRGKAQVGQKLLVTLENFARENGIKTLYLGTITTFTAALKFYQKHGFVAKTLADFPADFPQVGVDNVFLIKKLTD